MKKPENRGADPGTVWLETLGELLKGGAVSAGVTLGLALLCAVCISGGFLEEGWLEWAALGCCVLGAGAGGLWSVRKLRRRPLPVGLAAGAILFLILLTAGGLTAASVSVEREGLPILSACLCGGGGAGILSGPPKKKRRR